MPKNLTQQNPIYLIYMYKDRLVEGFLLQQKKTLFGLFNADLNFKQFSLV